VGSAPGVLPTLLPTALHLDQQVHGVVSSMRRRNDLLSNQRGLLLAALFSLSLCTLLLACGGDDSNNQNLDGPAIISRAITSTKQLNSFHFTLKVVGQTPSAGIKIAVTGSEGDFTRPTLVSAKINASYSGAGFPINVQANYVNGGSDKQFLLINGISNCWQPFPTLALDPAKATVDILSNLADLKLIGKDEKEDNSYHLSGQISADQLKALTTDANSGASLKVDIWISRGEYRLRRVLLSGPISKTDKPDATYDIRLSDYDKSVKVDVPTADLICK